MSAEKRATIYRVVSTPLHLPTQELGRQSSAVVAPFLAASVHLVDAQVLVVHDDLTLPQSVKCDVAMP